MQHHPARPTHMRSHHMHQQAVPPPHMALNLGPPQPQNAAAHQQQQQQAHHMNNGGPALAMQPPPPTNAQQQQQHSKPAYMTTQAHNRLSHHHPHQQQQQQQQHHLIQAQQQLHRINPQTIHTTTQMQKIRQQHQHQLVNNNSSNTNGNHSNNQHPQQQQQQHMGVHQQHPRNIHHSAQHVPHIKQHQQQQQQHPHSANIPPSISILKHQQQPDLQHQQKQHAAHIIPPNILKPQPQQQQLHSTNANNTSAVSLQQPQQQPHHHSYPGGSKTSYNNHNSNNNVNAAINVSTNTSMPKSILQNPNRASNNKQHNVVASAAAEKTTTNVVVVKSIKTDAAVATTPIVSAQNAIITTLTESSIITKLDAADDALCQDDKENVPSTANNSADELYQSTVSQLSGDNIIPCGDDSNSSNGSKEKTPMCLVNELARFNKITHQYRLTNEKGPAHCKRFTVTLKLGDEEYSAEGYKIKKAQHLAASEAIEKTKYKHPIPKTIRRTEDGGNLRAKITPTVELNALAMKLGQQTYYLFDPMQQPPPDAVLAPPPPGSDIMYRPPPTHGPPLAHGGAPLMPPPPPHMLDSNPYMRRHPAPYQRFNSYRCGNGFQNPNKFMPRYPLNPAAMGHNGGVHNNMPPHPHGSYPPTTMPSKITLIVGKQKFIGTGRTLQAAKHDAAARALQVLKTQAATKLNEILNRSIEESDSKSPISLVHEIGIKRNMPVHFKVLREEGPAHMKNFITACTAGNIITEGDGNGKKISKKRAAEKMLEELKKLPPLTPTKSPVKRIKAKPGAAAGGAGGGAAAAGTERKKRSGGASIKEKSEADVADSENPISKLIVLLQARKEAEPVYELISKNGNETTRRREFIMEVSAAGKVARGAGNNMKTAKRIAAHNLLEIICSESAATAAAAAIQPTEENQEIAAEQPRDLAKVKNVVLEKDVAANDVITVAALPVATAAAAATNSLPLVTTTAGQVPGILILRQNKKNAAKNAAKNASTAPTSTTAVSEDVKNIATKTTSAAATLTAKGTESVTATTTTTAEAQSDATTTLNTSATSTASATSTSSSSSGLRMKHQLLYLAQLLGFDVDFSDYPKGNHNEFLTIVTLSTTPAQICHGTGANSEESQNDAAKNALKILSELGLNNVKSK